MGVRWSRRDFLRWSAGAGAFGVSAVASGCSVTIVGEPRSSATTSSPTSTSPSPTIGSGEPIQILVTGDARPWCYLDETTGEYTGESPEVAKEVLRRLGIEDIEWEETPFDAQVPRLLTGGAAGMSIMAASGLSITAERCSQGVLFSEPDYQSLLAFAVPAGNPKGIQTFDDVISSGARLAVMEALPEREIATEAGVPSDQITALPVDPEVVLTALEAGEVDCAVLDDLWLRNLLEEREGNTVEATESFAPDGGPLSVGAFAFPAEAEDLVVAFNTELRAIHEDGTWLSIVEPFGFGEGHLPPADLTTEALCAG